MLFANNYTDIMLFPKRLFPIANVFTNNVCKKVVAL